MNMSTISSVWESIAVGYAQCYYAYLPLDSITTSVRGFYTAPGADVFMQGLVPSGFNCSALQVIFQAYVWLIFSA